jgi:hypothetical protein
MENKKKQNKTPHCPNNSKIKYQNRRKRQIDTTNTQMHDRALFCLGTDTSIKSGVDKR